MSTRDRLSRLTADLVVPPVPGPVAASPASTVPATEPPGAAPTDTPSLAADPVPLETRFPGVTPRQPGRKTGPGEMLAFRGQMLAAEGEVARLRDALQQFDGSLPTKKLDPATVVPSRWANRHDASFSTPDFIRFKADIEHAGGNVQPIVVRPLDADGQGYEIVFGHRRHRACQIGRVHV